MEIMMEGGYIVANLDVEICSYPDGCTSIRKRVIRIQRKALSLFYVMELC